MTTRLATIDPDLAARVDAATAESCRAAALAAARFAVDQVRLDEPLVERVLELLRRGQVGASPERSELEGLVAELDEEQWALQDRVDAGEATVEDHIDAFGRARAAASVYWAGDSDFRQAAGEAIYEASAAFDDLTELRSVVIEAIA